MVCKIAGDSSMKIKMQDGIVRTLGEAQEEFAPQEHLGKIVANKLMGTHGVGWLVTWAPRSIEVGVDSLSSD